MFRKIIFWFLFVLKKNSSTDNTNKSNCTILDMWTLIPTFLFYLNYLSLLSSEHNSHNVAAPSSGLPTAQYSLTIKTYILTIKTQNNFGGPSTNGD